ncbi:MAG: SpaH/EbpB family LPXTG-anchored major pilin [Lachnospiraceae bacterium]|nr:SpaH/EbpB family LPXTG-anchored major pilin [Lachnospiraceae bacterium]
MKRMKKVLSFVLTMVMLLTMAAPSFAAQITVNNALNGETYTVYKIFDVTKTSDGKGFAYSIKLDSPWKATVEEYQYGEKNIFTLIAAADDPSVFVVTADESFDETVAADFAATLAAANVNDTTKKEETAADGKAEFTDLEAGYYFVKTSVGALCALKTTDSLEVMEKNTIPSLTKEEDKTTAAIGDEVTYTITVTDGTGTNNDIIVYDYMQDGLTLDNDSFSVKVDGEVVSENHYVLDKNAGYITEGSDSVPYTFKITLKADYVKTLNQGDNVVITYKAKLDKDAEIYDGVNTNKAWLHYSEQITQPKSVDVATFKFDIIKTDADGKLLTGAKFKLYDAATGGNMINLVSENGTYRVADATEKNNEGFISAEIEAGKVTITGLDKTTYWLEETEAPQGYNKLTARVEVKLLDGNLVTTMTGDTWQENDGGVQVINNTGAELPSTGGIGTTVFYAVGIILMAGAVFFVVRRKKS